MEFKPFKDFVIEYEEIYKRSPKIEGTAIFLIRDLKGYTSLRYTNNV